MHCPQSHKYTSMKRRAARAFGLKAENISNKEIDQLADVIVAKHSYVGAGQFEGAMAYGAKLNGVWFALVTKGNHIVTLYPMDADDNKPFVPLHDKAVHHKLTRRGLNKID